MTDSNRTSNRPIDPILPDWPRDIDGNELQAAEIRPSNEAAMQVEPGSHRKCSRCGQPCNVEVCAACARRPSNPLVARLRTLAKGCAGVEGFDEEVACYTQAADEIERLTAAKAEQVALKHAFRKQLELVEAERDRLNKLVLVQQEKLAMPRAALERLMVLIAPLLDKPYGIAADEDAVVNAREALAGAAADRPKDRPPDETTTPREEPYKCNMHPGCPNPTPVPHWHE